MQKLTAIASKAPKSRHYNQSVPLEEHAARLYPDSQHNQSAWIKAVRYMRSHTPSIWQLDTQIRPDKNLQRY